MRILLRKDTNWCKSLNRGLTLILLAGILTPGCAVPEQGESEQGWASAGPEAVWQGSPQKLMQITRKTCASLKGSSRERCFLQVMKELGASPQAVRFAGRLPEPGFLLSCRKAGPVFVARVVYPFRAHALEGRLLVNGRPPVVDVDDEDLWPVNALEDMPEYQRLRSSWSRLSIRPGDRAMPGALAVQQQSNGSWRFIAGYVLESGQGEGEIAGVVDFAFDFDEQGTFLGSTVLGMAKTYHAVAGETVALTVKGENSGDSGWRATWVPPADVLRLVSKASEPGSPGEPVKETWTFRALTAGRIPVILQHLPGEGKGLWPDQRASFLVVIHPSREELASVLEEPFRKAIDRRLRDIQSPMAGRVVMEIVGVEGDTARVDIFPENVERLIGAAVYLKQRQGLWQVLSIGTEFDASFYQKHDIPWILQVLEEPENAYRPLPEEEASKVQEAVSKALGVEARFEPGVLFRDHVTGGQGTGCRITLEGTGERLRGLGSIAQRVLAALKDMGWKEDIAYAADGPLGTATGFRREAGRILFRVVREPAEEVGLLSREPPSLCELLPEEWAYTITLDCAQRP